MSCIKKQAMLEPLVDTVDSNQIVTHAALLKVTAHSLEQNKRLITGASFLRARADACLRSHALQ